MRTEERPWDDAPCRLHGKRECLRCMPPDDYYRWRVHHNKVNILHLPSYWAFRREHGV